MLMRAVIICLSVILIVGCKGKSADNQPNTNELQIGQAQVQTPVEQRRIAIVHSSTSADNFYDKIAYNQMFAAAQHQAMMAGLPFDLLSETDLLDGSALLNYDAIVMPWFHHVRDSDRTAIITSLSQAQQAGVSLVVAGELMVANQNEQQFRDSEKAINELLGLQIDSYIGDAQASVVVTNNTHPAMRDYALNDQLVNYDQIWFASFTPLDTELSTVLTEAKVGNRGYAGVQVLQRQGRVVHFANEQFMLDNNSLWSLLQWAVYGEQAPAALQVSRSESVFIARNDMDQAMVAASLFETEFPLLNIITDWKNKYNFVGSYYIDIGNNPENGLYTDWAVSAPLYTQYIELGSEIASHSWTHPHFTSELNNTELEFEFNQSVQEISTQLGVPVVGAAVPGNAESINVIEQTNQWLSYLSGRSGKVGSGYQGAIGFLEPQHDMLYFSLNMSPDFTLIDVRNATPEQAQQVWRDEIDDLLRNAQQPLLHWLWHDYGPTTQTAQGRYSQEMFEETLSYAASKGAEFATVIDVHDRIRQFPKVDFSVGGGDAIEANVSGTGLGQFSIKIGGNTPISSVQNWYAYNNDRVFIPDDGGQFIVNTGASSAPVTRITALPMRARLLSLNGDGANLNFTFEGQGEVTIALNPSIAGNISVTGADSFVETADQLVLKFSDITTHSVSIATTQTINTAPVANPMQISASTATATQILLSASDPENDALTYQLQSQPVNGVLSGTAPNLVYTPNVAFIGTDSFTFSVNDGALGSDAATVTIAVSSAPPSNVRPIANSLNLSTVAGRSVNVLLTGSDFENATLTYAITAQSQNGIISGSAPNLIYTPNDGYSGTDQLEFVVNDGTESSNVAQVAIMVVPASSQGTDYVSNGPLPIVVDGDTAEWSTLVSFGNDADDVSGANNTIDWRTAWIAHDATNLHIAYETHDPIVLSWGHTIFMDTDVDVATGYKNYDGKFPAGADYMLQGSSLYRYTGTGLNWGWEYVADGNTAVIANRYEATIPRALIDNPTKIELFFVGQSAAVGGDAIDYFPDATMDTTAPLVDRRLVYIIDSSQVSDSLLPVANPQSVTTTLDSAVDLLLTGSDGNNDVLSFSVVTQPANGVLSGVAPNLKYVPNPSFSGSDAFTFKVNDGSSDSETVTVSLTVANSSTPVNQPPVADGQAFTATHSSPTSIVLTGTDSEASELSFLIVTQPIGGVLSGTAPNLSYTPNEAFSGLDTFKFKVNDGQLDSAEAVITISVDAPVVVDDGSVYNPVNGLVVDGQLSDWSGTTSFGSDPDDVQGPDNPLDWREAWMAHDAANIYIAYRNDQTLPISWGYGIFVDTDSNPATGFRGFGNEYAIGADYLIEAGTVLKYNGTGNDWQWSGAGTATIVVSGDVAEMAIPRTMLGEPSVIDLIFRGTNEPYGGSAVDHYPDNVTNRDAAIATRRFRYKATP